LQRLKGVKPLSEALRTGRRGSSGTYWWNLFSLGGQLGQPLFDVEHRQFREIPYLRFSQSSTAWDSVPFLNASAATRGGCVLSVMHHISRLMYGRLRSISVGLFRPHRSANAILDIGVHLDAPFAESVIFGALIDFKVPIIMPDKLIPKSIERIGHIAQIMLIQAFPINEISATHSTGAT